MRLAAGIARLAALELVKSSRWWNRRKRRLMASTLVACAGELESAVEADRRRDEGEAEHLPAPPPSLSPLPA